MVTYPMQEAYPLVVRITVTGLATGPETPIPARYTRARFEAKKFPRPALAPLLSSDTANDHDDAVIDHDAGTMQFRIGATETAGIVAAAGSKTIYGEAKLYAESDPNDVVGQVFEIAIEPAVIGGD